jgi:hypothetical protein
MRHGNNLITKILQNFNYIFVIKLYLVLYASISYAHPQTATSFGMGGVNLNNEVICSYNNSSGTHFFGYDGAVLGYGTYQLNSSQLEVGNAAPGVPDGLVMIFGGGGSGGQCAMMLSGNPSNVGSLVHQATSSVNPYVYLTNTQTSLDYTFVLISCTIGNTAGGDLFYSTSPFVGRLAFTDYYDASGFGIEANAVLTTFIFQDGTIASGNCNITGRSVASQPSYTRFRFWGTGGTLSNCSFTANQQSDTSQVYIDIIPDNNSAIGYIDSNDAYLNGAQYAWGPGYVTTPTFPIPQTISFQNVNIATLDESGNYLNVSIHTFPTASPSVSTLSFNNCIFLSGSQSGKTAIINTEDYYNLTISGGSNIDSYYYDTNAVAVGNYCNVDITGGSVVLSNNYTALSGATYVTVTIDSSDVEADGTGYPINLGNNATVIIKNASYIYQGAAGVVLGNNSSLTINDTSFIGNIHLPLTDVSPIIMGTSATILMNGSSFTRGTVTVGSGSVTMQDTSSMEQTLSTSANGSLTLTMNTNTSSAALISGAVSTGTGALTLNMAITDTTYTKGIQNTVTAGPASSLVLKDYSPISGAVTVGTGSTITMQDNSWLQSTLSSASNGNLSLTMNSDTSSSALISGAVNTGTGALTMNMAITDTTYTKGIQNTVTAGPASSLVLKDYSPISNAVTLGAGSTITMQDNSWLKSTLSSSSNGNLSLIMNTNTSSSALISGAVNTGTGALTLNMAITDATYTKGIQNTVTAGNTSSILMKNDSPISGLVTLGTSSLVVMQGNSQMANGLTVGNASVVWLQDSSSLSSTTAPLATVANGNLTLNMYNDNNPADIGKNYYDTNATVASSVLGPVTTGSGALTLNMQTTDTTYTKGIQNTVTAGDHSNITMTNYSPINGLVTLGNVANVNMSGNSLMNAGLNAGGSPVGVAAYTTIDLSNSAKINGNVTIAKENSANTVSQITNFQMTNSAKLTGNISVDEYNILSLNANAQVIGNIDGNLNSNNGVNVTVKFGDVAPTNYVTQGQIDYIQQIIIYPSSSLTLDYAVTGTKGILMYENSTLNLNVNMTAGVNGTGAGTSRVINIGPNTTTDLQSAAPIAGVDYINVYGGSTFNAINSVDLSTEFFVATNGTAIIANGISGSANILNNGNLTLSSNAYIRGAITSEPANANTNSSLTIQGTVITEATSLTVQDVFAFSVTSPSNYDSIYIPGPIDMSEAVFAPTINFNALGTQPYVFHIARGRTGTLAQVADNNTFANLNTLFANYSIQAMGPDVVFSFERLGFGEIATLPYLKEVAEDLDSLALFLNPTPAQINLLESLAQSTNSEELDSKLSQLMSINTVPVSNIAFHPLAFQQIEWRMVPGSQSKAYSAGILGPDYSLWIKPFYSMSRQKSNADMTAFKTRTQGFVLGLDNNADTKDTIGAAISLVNSKLTGYAGYDAWANTNGYELLTYGQYTAHKNYYWEWIGMFGINVTDQTRNISFPGFSGTAQSNYSWMHGAAKLGVGHDFDFNDYIIWNNLWHWKADFMYAFSYQETGAGAANLQVKPHNVFGIETGLSSNVSLGLEIYDVKFINILEAAISYKVVNPKFSTTCQFVMGSDLFSIDMRQPRWSASLSARSQIHLTDSWAVGVDYKYEFNTSYRNHALDLSLRLDF